MEAKQDGAEHFGDVEKMPNCRPAEVLTAVTVAIGFYRAGGVDVGGVSKSKRAGFCKGIRISAVPCGHDTIEHVDACFYGGDYIGRRADTH